MSHWGLIFDMDGVLADTEPLSTIVTQRVLRELHNAEVDLEDIVAFTGSTAQEHYAFLAEKYAPDSELADLIAADDRFMLELLDETASLAFNGAQELFATAAADSACRPGLATGSGRIRAEATLSACALPSARFDSWLTGDDIAHAKPHPEIYERSARALGLPPDRCVAIEDSTAGVASAREAGMRCVAVTNTFPADELHRADRIVESLTELSLLELRALAGAV